MCGRFAFQGHYMPIPTSINDLSTTPETNSPAGSEAAHLVDNYLRSCLAFVAQLRDSVALRTVAADLASQGAAKGGALVGIHDPLGKFTATDATAALMELEARIADAESSISGLQDSVSGILLTLANFSGRLDVLEHPPVPGLLMHFDGGFTDACRGRTFTLSGSPAAASLGTPAKFGSYALATGSAMPITTTASPGDFNFKAGAFTIEFWIRRTVGQQVTGPLITYSTDGNEANLIWQVCHNNGEGLSIPVFRHTAGAGLLAADNAAFYTEGAWDHIAIVSGAAATTLRTYRNGVLVATRTRVTMPDTPAGVLTISGNAAALVDDLRVLPAEIYTANFTPPAAPLGTS